MRFRRGICYAPAAQSARRLGHAARRLERERQRAGLFAGDVHETPHGRLARLDAAHCSCVRRLREGDAAAWMRARCLLAAMPQAQASALRREWNGSRWLPGGPEYLLDLIRSRQTVRA